MVKRSFREQIKFRKNLINKYDTCIITGIDKELCDACHIKPYSICKQNEKFDINNGLLIKKDIHYLFDDYDITIDCVNLEIIIPDIVLNDRKYRKIRKYNRKTIFCHQEITSETKIYLEHHNSLFFAKHKTKNILFDDTKIYTSDMVYSYDTKYM